MAPKMIVGIAGGTASGKTTLARGLLRRLDATVIYHDRYYRTVPPEIACRPDRVVSYNYDHPEALDTRLLCEHLDRIRAGEPVRVPDYDYATSTRTPESEWTEIEPRPVIIVEGILVLSEPELRGRFDHTIFVDAPADIRLARRMRRDLVERGQSPNEVVEQYLTFVRPMHSQFVEPTKAFAHLVLDGERPSDDLIDATVCHLERSSAWSG